ncbi:MAG TPA: hypothetical protein VGK47_01335 [Nitrososphaeraceae archaeon]
MQYLTRKLDKMLKSSLSAVSTGLAVLAAIVSLFLAVHLIIGDPPTVKQPVELTTVYPPETYPVVTTNNQTSDAGVVSDAGPEKVRPTPQQLVKEFLLFDLLDLEKQATNPEDKELIRKAIEIKRQKIKEAELSNDFEKNMQKALE